MARREKDKARDAVVGRKKGSGRRKGRLLGEEKGNNIAKEAV